MEARSTLLSHFLPATLDVSVSYLPPLFGPDTIYRSFVRQMRVRKEEREVRVGGWREIVGRIQREKDI